MKVLQIFMRNPLRNFNYIIYSEVNNKAIFVDPLDIDKTLPIAIEHKLEPAWLLNTHDHPDHVKDNGRFMRETGASRLVLGDGEEFALSDRESIKAIHTPGHTDGHFCYLLCEDGEARSIISGDTLFNAGVGHCKLGGNPEQLYQTVSNIFSQLPDHLKVYPGHDYLLNNLRFAKSVEKDNQKVEEMIREREGQDQDREFTITDLKTEREINPFLRLEKLQTKFKNKSPREIFLELRSLRDKW